MLKKKEHSQIFYAILIILFLLIQVIKTSEASNIQPEIKNNLEQQDRSVDEAALTIQQNAIATLKKHLLRPKNNDQEQRLLIKLSEYYIEKSALEFRISFGSNDQKRKNKFLQDYNQSLRTSIIHLNTLIQKYPKFEDIDQAYYMRAKSYQELEQKNHARIDYEYIANNFPESSYLLPSLMSLGDYAIENNEHEKALRYFQRIESSPHSPHYPYALFKSGWSHFNLKNIDESLNYLEKHFNYYNAKEKKLNGLSSSDYAVRENTLLDIALFYFEGIESKNTKYSPAHAISYFNRFDKNEIFGKMSLRFSKLLRSREYNNELLDFKNQFLKQFAKNHASLSIIITSFEHFIHRRLWENALSTSKDFVNLYKEHTQIISQHENYEEAQELLLKTADDIRKTTIKNKNATKVHELTGVLAALYENFTEFVPKNDARIPGAFYNLAETLFTIQDYDKAKEHYRWIVDNKKIINTKLIDPKDAELKSISSFYEVLKDKKVIAQEVKAIPIQSSKPPKLDPAFERWISWLDQYDLSHVQKSKEFEAFLFEGIRSLYRFNQTENALLRLKKFIGNYPQSEFNIAAATLILDTYTLSSDWKNAHNYANHLRKLQLFEKTEFNNKLYEIASTSYYKIAENLFADKKYKDALDTCQDHLKRYSKSEQAPECLFLSSQSALHLENESLSLTLLSELTNKHKNSRHFLSSIYNKAKILESTYDFQNAASDLFYYYQEKLKLNEKDFNNEKKQDLKHAILDNLTYSYSFEKLHALVNDSVFCDSKLMNECKLKTAYTLLETDKNIQSYSNFISSLLKEKNSDLKVLGATLKIKLNNKILSPTDRIDALKIISNHYSKSTPLTQQLLTPYFHGLVSEQFKSVRVDSTHKTPLRATERSISNRIKKMEELEKLATEIISIPWKKLQIDILAQTAQIYFDFSNDLEKLTTVQDQSQENQNNSNAELLSLVGPFLKKGLALNKKAIEISQSVIIDNNIRSELLDIQNRKLSSLKSENQSNESTAIKLPFTFTAHTDFFDKLSPSLNIKNANKNNVQYEKSNEKNFLISNTMASIYQKKYLLSQFYLKILEGKKFLKKDESIVLKSFLLAQTGATAESFNELSKNMSSLEKGPNTYMTLSLAAYYTYTQDERTASEWLKKFIAIAHAEQKLYTRYTSTSDENFLIAYGISQYNIKTNPSYYYDLLTSVKAFGSKEGSRWAHEKLTSHSSQSSVVSKN